MNNLSPQSSINASTSEISNLSEAPSEDAVDILNLSNEPVEEARIDPTPASECFAEGDVMKLPDLSNIPVTEARDGATAGAHSPERPAQAWIAGSEVSDTTREHSFEESGASAIPEEFPLGSSLFTAPPPRNDRSSFGGDTGIKVNINKVKDMHYYGSDDDKRSSVDASFNIGEVQSLHFHRSGSSASLEMSSPRAAINEPVFQNPERDVSDDMILELPYVEELQKCWRALGRQLRIGNPEIDTIDQRFRSEWSYTVDEPVYQVLLRWRQKSESCTLLDLGKVFAKLGLAEAIKKIRELDK